MRRSGVRFPSAPPPSRVSQPIFREFGAYRLIYPLFWPRYPSGRWSGEARRLFPSERQRPTRPSDPNQLGQLTVVPAKGNASESRAPTIQRRFASSLTIEISHEPALARGYLLASTGFTDVAMGSALGGGDGMSFARPKRRFGPVVNLQLPDYVMNVNFHGTDRKIKPISNNLVWHSMCQEFKNYMLSRSQIRRFFRMWLGLQFCQCTSRQRWVITTASHDHMQCR
jgi:hypothetical protein